MFLPGPEALEFAIYMLELQAGLPARQLRRPRRRYPLYEVISEGLTWWEEWEIARRAPTRSWG